MRQSPKLSIPQPRPGDPPALSAIKHQIEVMNGTIGGRLTPLPAGASLAQCVAAINAIIARLNA